MRNDQSGLLKKKKKMPGSCFFQLYTLGNLDLLKKEMFANRGFFSLLRKKQTDRKKYLHTRLNELIAKKDVFADEGSGREAPLSPAAPSPAATGTGSSPNIYLGNNIIQLEQGDGKRQHRY